MDLREDGVREVRLGVVEPHGFLASEQELEIVAAHVGSWEEGLSMCIQSGSSCPQQLPTWVTVEGDEHQSNLAKPSVLVS